jgi:hypothetical protein
VSVTPRTKFAVLVLAFSFSLTIQPARGSSSESADPSLDIQTDLTGGGSRSPFRIPRASSEVGVDAVLDEPAWDEALRLELPYEVWPADNAEASARTEALLTYDVSKLYVAFRAYDAHPDRIRARLSDRDRAFQDDFVGIVLDTFNDERRAFEFFVNAAGVQMDLVKDDISGREDSSWDAIWDSAGRVTEDGYVVELSIPYTSLRFQRQDGDQVWGVDLVRIHPRDLRRLYAMNQRDRDVNCYLCQVSKLVGFEGATPGRNLEITPTVTAIRTDVAPDHKVDPSDPSSDTRRFSQRGLDTGEADYDPGITVKWGMTPNLTLSGTVNPDFSQVEADVGQLNVNQTFALFFPEKRPFFLEGADFFQTPLRATPWASSWRRTSPRRCSSRGVRARTPPPSTSPSPTGSSATGGTWARAPHSAGS